MQHTIVQSQRLGKCPKLPWMIEFHTTADGKVLNQQLKAAYADNHLEHLCSLHEKSKTRRKRLTQFSVVIPPKPAIEHIEDFLKAGMTVAMLKMDFFSIEEFQTTVELIRKVNEDFGKKIGRVYPLAIGLCLSESEIKTGTLQLPLKEIELEKGLKTNLSSNKQFANHVSRDYIYVNYDKMPDVVKPGDQIIVGDDIEMSAIEVARDMVKCIVKKAGLLTDNLPVKLPNVPLPSQEEKSIEKLTRIHEKCQVDIIFVGPAKVDRAKELLGPTVLVFLKIGYASSIENFDELVQKVDGVLIEGDKLLNTAKENVFIIQKSIIARCNKLGKPVVSFINCQAINKTDVNDIANTVIDGVDGLLLPADPTLLESISLICKAAESAIYQRQLFEDLMKLKPPPVEPIISVAIATVEASFKTNAAAIILMTTTGRSAKLISSYKPRCPIIALTRFGRIAKQLMIYKGVIPIFYVKKADDSFVENVERHIQLGMTFGKVNGYIRMGDAVVIVFGTKNNVGFRNCLEVVFASDCDTLPEGTEASHHAIN